MEIFTFTDTQVMELGDAARKLRLPVDETAVTAIGITYGAWLQERPPVDPVENQKAREQTEILGTAIQALIHKATAPLVR